VAVSLRDRFLLELRFLAIQEYRPVDITLNYDVSAAEVI
jgi:hypothetical protein